MFVEQDHLWIIQASPERIGMSQDSAKPIQEWDKIRVEQGNMFPALIRQLNIAAEDTGEAPSGHGRRLSDRRH